MTKTVLKNFGVESLEIERFRNFKRITVPLGRYITVISGQNATGKSTLLGMLGQPFGLVGVKDVFGRAMRAKFTDMFKLSPDHDIPGEHLYFVNLRDESLYPSGPHVQVKSYKRSEYKLPIRLVTGAKRGKGYGNIDYPVMYLGLRRTYPVGEIVTTKASTAKLTARESTQLDRWYKSVFMSWSHDELEPVELTASTAKKATILMNSEKYDYLANSAGQDNLGQILAALLSFGRIRAELGGTYRGGILLIDELDATLFPASQDALFDLLLEEAKKLDLQVVFTTHSFPLIEKAVSKRGRSGDVEVVYLRRRDSGIEHVPNPTMKDIKADLEVRMPSRPAPVKAEVLCEDEEAKWFLKQLLPKQIYSKCNVISAGLSCGELAELSSRDIPSLNDSLFVVDGDAVKSSSNKIRNGERLCILPTGDKNPERAIYDDLLGLPDDGEFWTDLEGKYHFSRQQFERTFEEEHRSSYVDEKARRRVDKAWFRKVKKEGGLGTNAVDAFRCWRMIHEEECEEFISNFEQRVDRIIRRVAAMAKRKSVD